MIVIVHALAGAASAHVSARALGAMKRDAPVALAIAVVTAGVLASVASHGVLDWMQHSYPVASSPDVCIGIAMSVLWCAAVRRRFRLLFALLFAASFAPDVIDHGPRILQRNLHLLAGRSLPGAVFPWHTQKWSGSLYPRSQIAPGSSLNALEDGRNADVSLANHLAVLAVASAGIFFGRSAFRGLPMPTSPRPRGSAREGS